MYRQWIVRGLWGWAVIFVLVNMLHYLSYAISWVVGWLPHFALAWVPGINLVWFAVLVLALGRCLSMPCMHKCWPARSHVWTCPWLSRVLCADKSTRQLWVPCADKGYRRADYIRTFQYEGRDWYEVRLHACRGSYIFLKDSVLDLEDLAAMLYEEGAE